MSKGTRRWEPTKARAAAVRRESDMEFLVRRAQDAFLPFLIVVLAWVVATSASAS